MTPLKTKESTTPDIRIDTQFFNNLKTRKLQRALGEHGVLCMVRLWCYVGERHPKGNLTGMTEEDLEDVAGWTGEKGVFAEYALRMRWAERASEGGIDIHDWEEHQPYLSHADKRKQAASLAANAKWEKHRLQIDNADRMRGAMRKEEIRNAPAPAPAPVPAPVLKKKRLNLVPHKERAEHIVAHYEETIDEDKSTHAQAVKNVQKLLADGLDSIVLGECMNLHLDEMERIGRERGYRIIPANFFGRKAVYKSYLDDARRLTENPLPFVAKKEA